MDGDGDPQAAGSSASGRITRAACRAIALALIVILLTSVAKYYHPGTGFTALIGFPAGHESEAPALRQIPHYEYAGSGIYDGQFYAQRALDPLVRDPEVDRAMDLAPFRARRILFSWTAYVAGLGRPAWILEVYALQNVVAWLILAAMLARWMPPSTPRGLLAWAACLFSHGLLWSVRFALLDGPSLVLTAAAILLVERGRPLASAAVAGINGLGRETNLIGVLAQPLPRDRRAWGRLAAAALLVVLPLLIWEDYLWSIYRSTVFAGTEGQTMTPGVVVAQTAYGIARAAWAEGLSARGLEVCIVLPLLIQAIFLAVRPAIRDPWWRVAAGYVLLMLIIDRVVWSPSTGAITRVLLPMTVGFNVLVVRQGRPRRFWPWFAFGNLHVIPALWVL